MKQITIFARLVLAFTLCLASCKDSNQAKQNSDLEKVDIDIPRTHWGISLGDTRTMVQERLSGIKIEKDKDEATELTYVIFNSLNNEENEKSLNNDIEWDIMRLENHEEYYSISIYWYSDKVAAIKINPKNDDVVAESVEKKYPLDICGSYSFGSLVDFNFKKYENDSTILISVERAQNYKYSFEKNDPRPTYEFIYVDRNLMDSRKQLRDKEEERMNNIHQKKVEINKSKY